MVPSACAPRVSGVCAHAHVSTYDGEKRPSRGHYWQCKDIFKAPLLNGLLSTLRSGCRPRMLRTTLYMASASRAIFQECSALVSCYANCTPNSLLLPRHSGVWGAPVPSMLVHALWGHFTPLPPHPRALHRPLLGVPPPTLQSGWRLDRVYFSREGVGTTTPKRLQMPQLHTQTGPPALAVDPPS